jgi:DNA polymerase kappa
MARNPKDIAAKLEDDMEGGGMGGLNCHVEVRAQYVRSVHQSQLAKSFNRWIKTKAELYEAGKEAKELLQPEWPLCLRLIGLRVTKLKDLQKKDGGILKVRACFL